MPIVSQQLLNTGRREGCRLAVRSAESIISTCSPVHPFAAYAALPLKGKQGVTGFAFVSPVVHDEVAIAPFLRQKSATLLSRAYM